MHTPALCPCGSPRPYADCCGACHDGRSPAPSADALMRSRYVAYVLDLRPYLLASWHPATRPDALPDPEPGLRWLGLEIKARTQADDDHATVTFVARSKLGGRAHRLHECSRFVREGGQWYYLDGDMR
jgi:SEC-C motif domain protein